MTKGRHWHAGLMAAVVASAGVYLPPAMAQQSPTNDELADLVRQQADQINRLNRRIDQLERDGQSVTEQTQRELASPSAPDGLQTAGQSPQETERDIDRRDPSLSAPSVPDGQLASGEPGAGPGEQSALAERVKKLEEEDTVRVDWSNGAPELSSPDGLYTFGIGGRVQYDFSSTFDSRYDGQDRYGDLGSRNITGSEFRRLRLDAHGELAGWVLYKLEVDFADDQVGVRDAYLATEQNFALGQGVVYLGSKFSDSGLDGRTSSKWTWFTERNVVANGIQPASGAYLTGITGEFYGQDDWHMSLGVNKGSNTGDNDESNNFTVLSRAHWNPIATDNYILHVGANGFYESFSDDDRLGYRPGVTIGGHYNDNLRVRSDAIDASSSTAFGLELAGLAGPFAAGAEYGQRRIETIDDGNHLDVNAYAAQIGYSLSGERFGYSTEQGVWTRPPIPNPVTEGGWGTWELVTRYQAIDFENSRFFDGGTGHGTTVGLNWYPNKFTRMMLDYTNWRTNNRTEPFGLPDDGNSINARAQVVF